MKLTKDNLVIIKEKLDQIITLPGLLDHAKEKDPVGLVYPYNSKEDKEASAFIVSTLSYGRQSTFRPIIKSILNVLGNTPVYYLKNSSSKDWETSLKGFRYRFNNKQDIIDLFSVLQIVYQSSTLESIFKSYYCDSIKKASIGTVAYLRSLLKTTSPGFRYLIPSPTDGSACKRLNMFLRWMVRSDAIDLGLWSGIPTEKLLVPLDTHIARNSLFLGLTNRKDASWRTAEDITDSLKMLDPKDPVKYDFALCTSGILGVL